MRRLAPIAFYCALWLSAWAVLAQVIPIQPTRAPNFWNANRMRLQEVAFMEKPPPAVLVGSSASYFVPQEALGPNIHNLGLADKSHHTGLLALEVLGLQPRLVIIEADPLLRAADVAMVDAMTDEPRRSLAMTIHVLREAWRPSVALFHALTSVFGLANQREGQEGRDVEKVVDAMIAQREGPVPHQRFVAELTALKSVVADLRARGVTVVFVRLPLHPRLAAHPYFIAQRAHADAAFPHHENRWVVFPSDGTYPTSDGIHMIPEAAERAAHQIRAVIEALLIQL